MHLSHVLEAQGEFRESAWHPQRRDSPDTPAIADSSKDRELGLLGERVKPDENPDGE